MAIVGSSRKKVSAEWISQVIVKKWEVRKMEAGVPTISGSLTGKGRSQREERVSQGIARIRERLKKYFFFI